jgi:hypothetical protein
MMNITSNLFFFQSEYLISTLNNTFQKIHFVIAHQIEMVSLNSEKCTICLSTNVPSSHEIGMMTYCFHKRKVHGGLSEKLNCITKHNKSVP